MGSGGFPFGNMQNAQYVPRLELPLGLRRFGGLSGSDNDLETQASVAVDMTAAEEAAEIWGVSSSGARGLT